MRAPRLFEMVHTLYEDVRLQASNVRYICCQGGLCGGGREALACVQL